MIRSFRTNVVCGLKLSRKRRWTSCTSPPLLVHSFSFLQMKNSSTHNDLSLASYCASGKNRLYSQKSGFHFYSTKKNGIPNKDEDENVPTQSQPTVWDQLKSVPNIITLSRLTSTPLICYWIVNDEPTLAIVGCFLAGISDALDGYIAKNHGGSTVLGTYLDPIADKFFINSLAISLWYTGILPTPLIFAWASKDLILLGGTAWYIYQEQRTINFFSNSITVTPSFLGKSNTVLQFATLAIGILTPTVPPEFLQPDVMQSLCWLTGASSIVTTLSYVTGGKGFKSTSNKP